MKIIIRMVLALALLPVLGHAQTGLRGAASERMRAPIVPFVPSDQEGYFGIARSAGEIASDDIKIKSHGAYCDGKSHLLSTMGLTLTQLQKVYGNYITSANLTEEADAAAIQGAINEARNDTSGAQNHGAGFILAQSAHITGASGVCMTGTTRIDATGIKSGSVTMDLAGMQIISTVINDTILDISESVGLTINEYHAVGSYADFAASIVPTAGAATGTMTVTHMNNGGSIPIGARISTNQTNPIATGTTILSQISGDPNGDGVYVISISQTVPAENIVTLGANECLLGGRTNAQYGGGYHKINGMICSGSFAVDGVVANSTESTTFTNAYIENFAPYGGAVGADGVGQLGQCSTVPGIACLPPNQQQSFNHFIWNNPQFVVHGINAPCIWEGQSHNHQYLGGYCHNDGPGNTVGIIKYFGYGASSAEDIYTLHFETGSLVNIMQFTGAAKPVVSSLTLKDHGPFQSGAAFASTSEVTSVKLWGATLSLDQLPGSNPTWWDNSSLYTVSGTIYSMDNSGSPLPGSFSGNFCTPICVPLPAPTFPSILNVSQVTNLGALDQIDVTNSGAFARSASNLPTITISAPPPGTGTQATAIATAWTINASGSIGTPGSGYPATEVVTDASDTCVGSGASLPTWTVTSVSGVPSSIKIKSRGFCPGTGWYNAGPISTTALTGTGLTIAGTNLGIPQGINSTAIVGAGSYPIGTAIAVSFGGSALPANLPAATAKASGNLQLGAGGNSLTYNSAGIFTTGPFAGSAASGGTGFQQSLTSPYATGQVLTYGAIVDNAAGDVYQVVNIGCTTADPAGPTVLSGTQTTADGCQYVFLQAGLLFDEEVISDEGATDMLPRCLAVIGAPNQDACLYATPSSPNGLLTAPAGSLALDTGDMVACVNQDGGTTWGCLTPPAPLPASGTWTPVLTAATPGDIAFSNVTAQGDYDRIALATGCVVHTSWTWTGTVTYTNASGNLQVTGLPYQRLGNGLPDEIGPAGQFTGVTFPASQIAWEIMPGTKLLQLRGFKSGSSVGVATIGNAITSGSTVTIGGSGSYRGQGC